MKNRVFCGKFPVGENIIRSVLVNIININVTRSFSKKWLPMTMHENCLLETGNFQGAFAWPTQNIPGKYSCNINVPKDGDIQLA